MASILPIYSKILRGCNKMYKLLTMGCLQWVGGVVVSSLAVYIIYYYIIILLYFSQNQKGFGCIGAAVLLILSPKELI